MPTYDYKCPKCQENYEVKHSIDDCTKRTCPECLVVLEKQITYAVGLVFKGPGFYETDYKKKDCDIR